MYAKLGLALLPLVGCYLVGYMWLTPLPPGLANPYLFRFVSALSSSAAMAAGLGKTLGLGEANEIFNTVKDYQFSFFMDNHAGLEVRKAEFDGVPVVIYKPLSVTGTLPVIVFFHGGGFISGSSIVTDGGTSEMARDMQAVVVSVDYRLAPKHPYPAGLDDCYAVTKYVIQHAREFDLDPHRVAVAGTSAGGNFAAAVALRFRDSKEPIQPKLQLLIQPLLQTFNLMLPSYQQNHQMNPSESVALSLLLYMGDVRFLENLEMPPEVKLIANNSHTSIEMKRAYRHIFDLNLLPESMRQGYDLQVTTGSTNVNEALVAKYSPMTLDPYAYPLMANNLEGLPRAFIMTSEYDTLRDDGILYAKHLEKAGVPITWYHSPDTFHICLGLRVPLLYVDTTARDAQKWITFLKENL